RPDFYLPRVAEPQVERCRHGLDPQQPTGIVMFGGHGSKAMLAIAERIPAVMDLADFFIGKPGPGSISEAIQRGLPVIVAQNAWTMPQERYNGQWVRENGVGLVIAGFRSVARAVDTL